MDTNKKSAENRLHKFNCDFCHYFTNKKSDYDNFYFKHAEAYAQAQQLPIIYIDSCKEASSIAILNEINNQPQYLGHLTKER